MRDRQFWKKWPGKGTKKRFLYKHFQIVNGGGGGGGEGGGTPGLSPKSAPGMICNTRGLNTFSQGKLRCCGNNRGKDCFNVKTL